MRWANVVLISLYLSIRRHLRLYPPGVILCVPVKADRQQVSKNSTTRSRPIARYHAFPFLHLSVRHSTICLKKEPAYSKHRCRIGRWSKSKSKTPRNLANLNSLAYVGDPLGTIPAVALCGGVALYLLGHNAFRLRDVGSVSVSRLVAAMAPAAAVATTSGMESWWVTPA